MGLHDFNRSRIPGRQRGDVGDQFWFVEDATFLVSEDAVVREVFLPWRLIAGNNGIVKLLRTTDQFVLRNRNIRGMDEGYCEEECDERQFHRKE